MPVKIDYHKCNGCRNCYTNCPLDVIGWDEEKDLPFVKYPDECQICHICEAECPTKAIKVTMPLIFW
jgi:NAD-dependent dihydropyrimidine dehydrogenase PreA subunit